MQLHDYVIQRNFERGNKYYFYLAVAWLLALFTLLLLRNLVHSAHGRAITAVRDDERAAELLGVNLARYKVLVFVIGAGLAGLAGAVFANYNDFITPDNFNFNMGVLLVVMVVLGGMGSFTGTVVATTVLYFAYFVPELYEKWLPQQPLPIFYDPSQGEWVYREVKDLRLVLFALLLIVLVLLRPQGIMGKRELSLTLLRDASKYAWTHRASVALTLTQWLLVLGSVRYWIERPAVFCGVVVVVVALQIVKRRYWRKHALSLAGSAPA
jgi:ABC-type branched-subunit amino acid transport system permease subunit